MEEISKVIVPRTLSDVLLELLARGEHSGYALIQRPKDPVGGVAPDTAELK